MTRTIHCQQYVLWKYVIYTIIVYPKFIIEYCSGIDGTPPAHEEVKKYCYSIHERMRFI